MTPHIEQLELEQDTGAPRRARHFLTALLTSWGLPSETVETFQLLASELVSNAILHGRAPINMSVKVAGPPDLGSASPDRVEAGGARRPSGGERETAWQTADRATCSPGPFVIRVEVSNNGEGVPTLRVAGRSDPSGRGLKLVEDLSRSWGSSTTAGHTCVWFEITA